MNRYLGLMCQILSDLYRRLRAIYGIASGEKVWLLKHLRT